MTSLANRPRPTYERSGRVAWLRFLPAGLLALGAAAGMGWCWFLARAAGWDYWLLTGAVLALPVGLAGSMAVARGHCRNKGTADTLSVLALVVFFGAYFYSDMVGQLGPAALTRVDLLPEFIYQRVTNDPVPAFARKLSPRLAARWRPLIALTQMMAVAAVISGLTYRRSFRGYCENCGQWMRTILLHSEPGKATAIAGALENGDLQAIPVTTGRLSAPGQPFSSIEFEHCRGLQVPGSTCVAYLSLTEIISPRKFPNTLLSHGQLSPAELDVLAQRLPVLAWVRVSAPPAADGEELSGPSIDRHTGTVAAFQRLPADAGTRDFDRVRNRAMLISVGWLLLTVVSLVVTVLGLRRSPWLDPVATSWPDWLLLAAGATAAIAGSVVCWINIDYPAILYASRWLRGVIAERPDALVDVYNPASHVVSVVPRSQWHQLHSTKPVDVGVLLVDPKQRRLLFEGVKERYVIPADAVVKCVVERIIAQSASVNFFAVVLTVRCADSARESLIGGYRDGCWEVPFVCRANEFRRYNTAYRRGLADKLRSEIGAISATTKA
jgi:hypothetical protein